VREGLRGAVSEAVSGQAEAKAALEAVNEAVRRLAQEQPLIAGEVAMIEQQLAEAARKATETEQTAGEIDAQNLEKERAVGDFNRRLEELTLQRDTVRNELMDARVAAGKLVAKRTSLSETINHLRNGIRTADEAAETAGQERADGQRKIEDSEGRILEARQRLDELGASAERLEAGVLQLRRRREMVRVESEQLNVKTRTLRSELEEVEGKLHRIEMQRQESAVRRDELVTRVRDELAIELEELYEDYDHNERDWAEVEAEIAELRQKIARLGNVNLDAINEQAELEEREQFLSSQWQDLEDSRRQLESLIDKLDCECVERFTTAFETVRENFKDLFRRLFGGGKADVVLENPEDVLESGIEILARPPGKELQRISLMSGGEKTMTAIALLMSIFRSRPSPLALLDEVDAALDEANNVRYNGIIQEFLDRSQFLLVTHSKRTMAIADHLYGVTMQEPGVSSRVSVKFDGDKTDESAVA
jgi:chromosome segregation protein